MSREVPIGTTTAKVFYGGGRRYFTLKAACRAQARKSLRDRARSWGENARDFDHDWYMSRLERLTRFYLAIHKSASRKDKGHG